MKILCLHQGYELYGSDRSFLLSLQIIKKNYPQSHLTVIIPKEGPLVKELLKIADELLIRDIGSVSRQDLKSPFKTLRRVVSIAYDAVAFAKKYDLVYINTVVVLSYICAARFLKSPAIVHVREIPGKLESLVFSAVLRFGRPYLLYNSQNTQKAFFFRKTSREKVILNAVEGFAAAPVDLPEPVRFLMIGRINAWKGQLLLADAIAALPPEYQEKVRVRFVGDVPSGMKAYADKLFQCIQGHKLQHIVEMCPFTDDPAKHYQWANVVVVPSVKPEPFGRVAIEGMSAGRPVLAARHGGLVEIVEEGKTGWFFQPGDTASLVEKIRHIIEQPHEISEKGVEAEKAFNERFTTKVYEEKFMNFFNDVLR